MSEEKLKQQNEGPPEAAKTKTPRAVSERKLEANRNNAKKSTGPKTARGKRYSSFNSLKHGLVAKKVMFSADGKPVEGLQPLAESLCDRFGSGDIFAEVMIELFLADYWRTQEGFAWEIRYLKDGAFDSECGMPNLTRYVVANRRALEKSMQTLREIEAEQEHEREEDSSAFESVHESPSESDGNPPQEPPAAAASQEGSEDENCNPETDHQGRETLPASAVSEDDLESGKKAA